MSLFLFIAAFLLPSSPACALEIGTKASPVLSSQPVRPIRLPKRGGRKLASVDTERQEKEAARRALDEKLGMGSYAIIQGSTDDWNNQVVRVVARFEDGSRRVQLENGTEARIAFKNLHTLSPETGKCCQSNGVNICRNDRVYHPLPTAMVGVPMGKVRRLFENCATLVRDGLDYIYDAKQLGKSVDCSPQKDSVCVGKVVYVQAYYNGGLVEMQGPVEQVFTNGTALVRSAGTLMPVDVAALTVQTESILAVPAAEKSGPVITSRDGQRKIFVPTMPEVEPFDANSAQELLDERGITAPTTRTPASVQ